MPELPEVESLRRDLQREILGRRIQRARVLQTRMTRGQSAPEIQRRVEERRVEGISRRGKYLLLELDGCDTLLLHRGMSGNLLLRKPADGPEPHLHVVLELDDGRELRLVDPRGFGEVQVLSPDQRERHVGQLGVEPLSVEFAPGYLARRFAGRSAPVKMLLLNQALVAGLGNIYTDEALWAARIHPARPAGSLGQPELEILHREIRRILGEAIEHRGTTFRSAVDLYGQPGAHASYLQVFGRAPGPCARCGAPLAVIRVYNRGSSFCTVCQQLRGSAER